MHLHSVSGPKFASRASYWSKKSMGLGFVVEAKTQLQGPRFSPLGVPQAEPELTITHALSRAAVPVELVSARRTLVANHRIARIISVPASRYQGPGQG
jgi:hypothetical protein